MRFHPRLAPIKAAFLPLVNKEGMDEVGTPFCVTIDRDTLQQTRVSKDKVMEWLKEKLQTA